MSDQAATNPEFIWQTKWWAFGGRFPLLPILIVKPANRYNTWGFYFQWLGFRVWTMDSPDIGFEVNLSDQDLAVRMRIPFLIVGFWLPLFPSWFMQKTWRRPTPTRGSSSGEGADDNTGKGARR